MMWIEFANNVHAYFYVCVYVNEWGLVLNKNTYTICINTSLYLHTYLYVVMVVADANDFWSHFSWFGFLVIGANSQWKASSWVTCYWCLWVVSRGWPWWYLPSFCSYIFHLTVVGARVSTLVTNMWVCTSQPFSKQFINGRSDNLYHIPLLYNKLVRMTD